MPKYPRELAPETLLAGYCQGCFPMGGYDDGQIRWFEPEIRGIIPLDDRFHIPHGLKRFLKKNPFTITMDENFKDVIQNCRKSHASEGEWIDDKMIEAYTHLHELGFAHSVEVWDDEGLQGGLYGIALGQAFFGESMFHNKSNASKIALLSLISFLRENHFILLDSQWLADHLKQYGAYEVSKKEYHKLLKSALKDILIS